MTSEPNDKSSRRTTARRPRRKRIALMLLVMVICAAGAMSCWKCYPAAPAPLATPTSNPASDDVRFRKLVLGVWTDDYEGKRTMTLRPDGTGTMLVELSGMKAMMFASKLRFDMVWSIEAGRLKKRTIGGEPSGRVRLILATMGDRVDEPIIELTDRRLLLLDADGKTKYDWRRVD